MESIYLDYASTTPVDPRVLEAMMPCLEKDRGGFGNPNSLHFFGQKALVILDEARTKIAKTVFANYRDIVFTSSATEANNLVIRGSVKSYFRNRKTCSAIPKIIISSAEHPSVMETVRDLAGDGAVKAVFLPVDKKGVVDLDFFKNTVDYAKAANFGEYYLWGAEWWFWLKVKHNMPEFWDFAKIIF